MTDIQACGLASDLVSLRARSLVCTVDFEAFAAPLPDYWHVAMQRWVKRSQSNGIPFTFFLSVEEALQLADSDGIGGRRLGEFLAELQRSGHDVHPHNHYVFDPANGKRLSLSQEAATAVPYSKRRSMFFDAVHVQRLDIADWLQDVVSAFHRIAGHWDMSPPPPLAFRAGGWDYGSTCDEIGAYLIGLRQVGVEVDSSASRGIFGTRSWGVGAPFGSNVFRIADDLLEVAPCLALDCGNLPTLRELVNAWRGNIRLLNPRERGALVLVVHFDHLFHVRQGGGSRLFRVTGAKDVEARVDQFFRWLNRLIRVLFLEPVALRTLARRAGTAT